MSELLQSRSRMQSLGEEIANSLSHAVALLAATIAGPILVFAAVQRGGAMGIVGASVFAVTVLLLYLTSTIYHALPVSRAKRLFQILDHGAIYLLIAGTYTPFTLGVLHGAWGWSLFVIIWGLALAGVVLKLVRGLRYPVFSTSLYLGMGWLALVAAKPLWLLVPTWGIVWLVAGGIAYTVGVLFFLMDERVRYSHFVWHLFVMAGTTCHFIAVLQYAA